MTTLYTSTISGKRLKSLLKKSKTLTAKNINSEVNTLFQRAVFKARKDGGNPTESLKMFFSGLNFFCSEINTKAGKRYELYLGLKAKRSSQSSQSDEWMFAWVSPVRPQHSPQVELVPGQNETGCWRPWIQQARPFVVLDRPGWVSCSPALRATSWS